MRFKIRWIVIQLPWFDWTFCIVGTVRLANCNTANHRWLLKMSFWPVKMKWFATNIPNDKNQLRMIWKCFGLIIRNGFLCIKRPQRPTPNGKWKRKRPNYLLNVALCLIRNFSFAKLKFRFSIESEKNWMLNWLHSTVVVFFFCSKNCNCQKHKIILRNRIFAPPSVEPIPFEIHQNSLNSNINYYYYYCLNSTLKCSLSSRSKK